MPTPPSNPPIDPAIAAADAKLVAEQKQKAGEKPLENDSPSAKFLRSVIGDEPKKPEPKKKPDPEEGEEAEKKPAPKKKPAAPPAPVIDEQKLGAAIGRSLAEHSKGEGRARPDDKEAEKPKPSAKEEAEARRIAVLERMESVNPERYKGLAGRYKANQATLKSRVAAWEKTHPGESYADMLEAYEDDPDSHPEFADEAKIRDDLDDQVDWDDEDYDEAKYDLRDAKKIDEKLKPLQENLDERISEVERADKVRRQEGEIAQLAYSSGNEYWKLLGKEAEGVVGDDGRVNMEVIQAITEADPLKGEVFLKSAQECEGATATLYMIAHDLAPKGSTLPYQNVAGQFALQLEEEMLARPDEKQRDDYGRPFIRKSDYLRLNPEQRDKYWTFSALDMWNLSRKGGIPKMVAKQAQDFLQAEDEKFLRRAKARGLIRDEEEPAARTARKTASLRDELEGGDGAAGDDNSGKPLSPAFTLSPKTSAGKGGRGSGAENAATRFVRDIFP